MITRRDMFVGLVAVSATLCFVAIANEQAPLNLRVFNVAFSSYFSRCRKSGSE